MAEVGFSEQHTLLAAPRSCLMRSAQHQLLDNAGVWRMAANRAICLAGFGKAHSHGWARGMGGCCINQLPSQHSTAGPGVDFLNCAQQLKEIVPVESSC